MTAKTQRDLVSYVPLDAIKVVSHNFFREIANLITRTGSVAHGPLPGDSGSSLLAAQPAIRSKKFHCVMGKALLPRGKKMDYTAREGHDKIRLRVRVTPDSTLVDNSPTLYLAKPLLQQI